MQTLINTRSQWLDNGAKIPVNGKVYVYVDGSSTSLVKLYSDAALENEVPNPQILDTAGRLGQTVYFEENSVFVKVFDEPYNFQQLLFSFYLEGKSLKGAGLSIMSLEELMESGITGDCLVYHAKKLKYLLWSDEILPANGITTWNAFDDSGSWRWETTVLDIFDIGIMEKNINASARFSTAAQLNPAVFTVKSGAYGFDDAQIKVNWQDTKVVVEADSIFFNYNSIWKVELQPDIHSKLHGVEWNSIKPCDFRASLVDKISPNSVVNRFFADADFEMRFDAVETFGLEKDSGGYPIISVAEGYNAGKLIGNQRFFNPASGFREGKLSQMKDTAASFYNCSDTFYVDEEWEMSQSSVRIPCDVVVDKIWYSKDSNNVRNVSVRRILRARGTTLGGGNANPINIEVTVKDIMIDNFCFFDNPNGRKSAQLYTQNFKNMNPIIRGYKLGQADGTAYDLIDGAIYDNCIFYESPLIKNTGRIIFRNCIWSNKITIQRLSDMSGNLLFDNCEFEGGIDLKVEGNGIPRLKMVVRDCVTNGRFTHLNSNSDFFTLFIDRLYDTSIKKYYASKGKFFFNDDGSNTIIRNWSFDNNSKIAGTNLYKKLKMTVDMKNCDTIPYNYNGGSGGFLYTDRPREYGSIAYPYNNFGLVEDYTINSVNNTIEIDIVANSILSTHETNGQYWINTGYFEEQAWVFAWG